MKNKEVWERLKKTREGSNHQNVSYYCLLQVVFSCKCSNVHNWSKV